jgi:pantoate--beta-alanine ligase
VTSTVLQSIDHVRTTISTARQAGARIGLVPTMGALHAGHARLIERAGHHGDYVVVSIFVNPLQFDRPDDLDRYPRTLDSDVALCSALGVDVVFSPTVSEMYPAPPACTIHVGAIASHLCGRYRPGHFDGVATVVMKLFEIVRPDRVYFGEKDAQQLAVIRHLVRDFNVPIEIEAVETVRESDGLALSSRNARLNAEERRLATSLYGALREARRGISEGATRPDAVRTAAAALIPNDQRLRLEYLEIVDPEQMQPVERIEGPVIAAGALWVGSTRLIDNLKCEPPQVSGHSVVVPK